MKRVVVTGIGVIAPCGNNKEEYWSGLEEGISRIESDAEMIQWKTNSRVLARVKNFDIHDYCLGEGWDAILECDRFVHFGVASGIMAIQDSGLAFESCQKVKGIIFASAIGGTPLIETFYRGLSSHGKNDIEYAPLGKRFYNSGMFNFPATVLAQKYQFQGPVTSLSTGCTAGLDALGLSVQLIRAGEADIMLAGASEAPLTPLTYATLDIIKSLSTADCPSSQASRPFDKKRAGFVISEGAAFLVLEELEAALARGASIYAEVLSYASKNNALHMNELPSHGNPMAEVMEEVLGMADLAPHKIDYLNAHGSSTQQNDIFETNAYKKVFGSYAKKIPISSTKSMIGHSLSSASLLGAIAALGAICRGVIHPTANYEFPDEECDLFYVPNSKIEKQVVHAMVTASGFGGIHSSAIFKRYPK